jgi:hypothetical protein
VGGPTACLSLAERREDAINDRMFDDEHWAEDFDGWLIDQTIEESGIIAPDREDG